MRTARKTSIKPPRTSKTSHPTQPNCCYLTTYCSPGPRSRSAPKIMIYMELSSLVSKIQFWVGLPGSGWISRRNGVAVSSFPNIFCPFAAPSNQKYPSLSNMPTLETPKRFTLARPQITEKISPAKNAGASEEYVRLQGFLHRT